jgi:hypothetical protein
MHMGAMELLVMLALTGGGTANDLAAWLNGEDYFKSRQIDMKIEKMIELANTPPTTAKASIAQLLAVRWLGEHPAEAKKDKNVRELLVQIALGKKNVDAQGFARDYAQRALALIDAKPVPTVEIPKNSMSEEAARWFPEQCTFFGGVDLRASGQPRSADAALMRARLLKLVPDQFKEQIYQFAETVGNIRVDRFVGASWPDPKEKEKGRIYFRFTGRADPERLAKFFAQTIGGRADPNQQPPALKKEIGPKGEPILLFSLANRPPAIAVVGDSDLIMAGFEGDQGDHAALLQQVLNARAGRQANLTTGPLGASLKRVPAQTFAVILGEPPEGMRRDLTRAGSPITALPQTFLLDLTRDKNMAIRFEGTMAKPEEARALAETAQQLKQKAIDYLKEIPADFKIKKESIELFRKAVESVQVRADGATIKAGAEIAGSVFTALQEAIEILIMDRAGPGQDLQPPPAKP